MKLQFIIGIMILLLATCSMQPPASANTTNTGIEGQVFIGPMCPVIRQGQACPDQPYQATLTVNSLAGRKIAQVQTDQQGRFKISLAPGQYILHPESPNTLPFASEQTVTVEDGLFTQVIVNYDSGIR